MARNHKVPIRLNKEEYELLKEKADAASCPLATYIRMLALAEQKVISRPLKGHV